MEPREREATRASDIDVVYGHAQKIGDGHVELAGGRRLDADYVIACAGGLATPVLLATSLGRDDGFVPGYHDHPMAYVAKVKLRPDSQLKAVSCTTTRSAEVRAGIVYETDDLKTVIYLRPAVDMRLGSITGPARYILSDLRNDPFSPKKIMMLLGNLEAVREAILFKTRLGFRGDYYSVLILGEQTPLATRGLPDGEGQAAVAQLARHARGAALVRAERRQVLRRVRGRHPREARRADAERGSSATPRTTRAPRPASSPMPGDTSREFFAVTGLPNTFVCDGSLLRAAGIANSGLTLVALGYRLAELLRASA